MSRNEHIEQHFRENYDNLVRRIKYRNCDVPEDVVQESYFRALKYYSTYSKEVKGFDAWFNTILNNSLRFLKTQEKERGITKELREEEIEAVEKTPDEIILSTIDEMSSGREKQILIMYFILGFKTREVSEYLGLSHSNIRIIIMRWRNKIEKLYDLSN